MHLLGEDFVSSHTIYIAIGARNNSCGKEGNSHLGKRT